MEFQVISCTFVRKVSMKKSALRTEISGSCDLYKIYEHILHRYGPGIVKDCIQLFVEKLLALKQLSQD